MPESRTRKTTAEKQKLKAQRASKPKKVKAPASRRWVPPTFITVGLLGVAWLITFYVAGQMGDPSALSHEGALPCGEGAAPRWQMSRPAQLLVRPAWLPAAGRAVDRQGDLGVHGPPVPSRAPAANPTSAVVSRRTGSL